MYYSCLKCRKGFNANFTPHKTRPCKECGYPCIPEGKRLEAKGIAIKTLRYYISHYGDLQTWDLLEKSITNPMTRLYLRHLFNIAMKRRNKK